MLLNFCKSSKAFVHTDFSQDIAEPENQKHLTLGKLGSTSFVADYSRCEFGMNEVILKHEVIE